MPSLESPWIPTCPLPCSLSKKSQLLQASSCWCSFHQLNMEIFVSKKYFRMTHTHLESVH